MIYLTGNVSTQSEYPYIYIINKEDYVYIGETKRPNYTRLSEHLIISKDEKKESGFRNILATIDNEIEKNETILIRYFSIGLSEYFTENLQNSFSISEFTKLFEADLHRELLTNCNRIIFDFQLISNIQRTHPIPSKKTLSLQNQIWYIILLNTVLEKVIVFLNQSKT